MNKSLSAAKIERGTLTQKVASVLRKAIIEGTFMPGERLRETRLSEELDVSRAPIREALRILDIEGLVEIVSQKGARVRGLTERDVDHIYDLRSALDSLAVRLAIPNLHKEEMGHLDKLMRQMKSFVEKDDSRSYQRLNSEFHNFFYQKSKNPWLCDAYNNLMHHIMRLRSFSLSLSGRLGCSYQEHASILDAVRKRKIREAEEISRKHTREAGKFVLKLFIEKEKRASLIQ